MHPSLFTLPCGKDRPCCTSQRESPETLVSISISKTDSSSPISWEATLPLPPDSAKFRVYRHTGFGSIRVVRTSLSRPVCIVPREGGSLGRDRKRERERRRRREMREKGGRFLFLRDERWCCSRLGLRFAVEAKKRKKEGGEKGYHDHSTKRRLRGRKGAIP